jgi:hypothetical protein
MFGGLAAYLFERQMLVLIEPTKSGCWNWHGVLVCTDYEHHTSIQAEFPALMPHEVLRKWLFIDSTHEDFESTMEAVARRVVSNDPRFGIFPKSPKPKRRSPRDATPDAENTPIEKSRVLKPCLRYPDGK